MQVAVEPMVRAVVTAGLVPWRVGVPLLCRMAESSAAATIALGQCGPIVLWSGWVSFATVVANGVFRSGFRKSAIIRIVPGGLPSVGMFGVTCATVGCILARGLC